MKQSGDYLPTCKEDAFTAAVVKACDPRDGVTDGIISDPADCHWNPATLIGTVTPCGTITATDAAVVVRIWSGPVSTRGSKLWYGLEPGASFDGLAATTTVNGVTGPAPFPISATWLGTWLQQNPSWNWQILTYAQFDRLFQQSVREFSGVIATDNPNLSQFKRDGGKILIWHGLADQLIFPQAIMSLGGTTRGTREDARYLHPRQQQERRQQAGAQHRRPGNRVPCPRGRCRRAAWPGVLRPRPVGVEAERAAAGLGSTHGAA
jgi:feruloyl esterase